jgi:hypothetical protein
MTIDQAKILSQMILDWADHNLDNWDASPQFNVLERPNKAKEIYDAAKILNEILIRK